MAGLFIIIAWGIFSSFRIYRVDRKFDPFNGNFLDFLGFVFGLSTLIGTILYECNRIF